VAEEEGVAAVQAVRLRAFMAGVARAASRAGRVVSERAKVE
jgi:hypothetical protein